MKKLSLLIGMLFLFGSNIANTQTIDVEKTYELTGKSKRGTLAQVERTDGGNYKLYYITKANNTKAKIQVYSFDQDFNFMDLSEEEILFDKIKAKYSWFNFNGELYSVDAITLNWNPAAPLKLKKKRITYKYDWLLLGYHKTVKVLEKVKPRDEDGNKYFAKKYFEDESTGDLYILAGVAPGMVSKDAGAQLTDLRLIKFDWNLNKVAETKIPFEYGQEVAFGQAFTKPDANNKESNTITGGVLVFAPTVWKGSSAPKDDNKGNFTYVEFDKDCKLLCRESFDNPSPGWKIEGAQWIESEGGREVYLYGPAAFGKDKYYNVAVQAAKKKSVQVMKVKSGKVEYLTETLLEDFESMKVLPSNDKKGEAYNGKYKPSMNFLALSTGGFLLYGQYYNNEGQPGDYTAWQFDANGKLVANYMRSMTNKVKFKSNVIHNIFENENGVYWAAYEPSGTAELVYYNPVITKINVKSKTMSDPVSFGMDGKKQVYFIDKSFPMLSISSNQHVYFGSDKRGKNIWFCRVKL